MKNFSDLTEQELLALAITLEEEDSRTYADFAEGLRENYSGTARMFGVMADEENGHRHRLLDLYRKKFGEHIPLIRRQDVKGFIERRAVWLLRPLGLDKVRARKLSSWRPKASGSTQGRPGSRPMPPVVSFSATSQLKSAARWCWAACLSSESASWSGVHRASEMDDQLRPNRSR
jgi:hypothetical protein